MTRIACGRTAVGGFHGPCQTPIMPPVASAEKSALFAQYQILEELGDFPNYSLYKVRAPGGAIKLWKKVDLQFNAGGIETRLLPVIERVHHPFLNTVTNSFHFPDKGLLFVESEFPAKTLRHRLAECRAAGATGGVPVTELFSYMSQSAEAIDFLNSPLHLYNGRKIAIYHRAVSPDSLQLFEEKGRVVCKVGDFGLAKPIVDTTDSARHSLGLTNFDYSPPEYDDGIIANTSDQFALATTYCELKTGKLPFTGSLLQKLQAQLNGTPDLNLLEVAERPILTRALAREPQARFPTCKEFVQQLQAAHGGVSTFAVASSRVLGKSNGATTEATTGWGGSRPVGKSGGTLFDIGAKHGSNKPASKPEAYSTLGSVTVATPRAVETKLSTVHIEKKERKERNAESPRAKELPVSPNEKHSAQKPAEHWKPEPRAESVDPPSNHDTRWTPGQVTAVSTGTTAPSSNPELTVDPPTSRQPVRHEISDKAKGTLDALKKRHHQTSSPGTAAPEHHDSRGTSSGPGFGSVSAPPREPSLTGAAAGYHVHPAPARRGSTDHIGGDKLPFRPPPVPTPRRSSSPAASAAATVTPFQALRTNVPEEKTQGTSVLTLFLVGFSAFCLALFAIAYFSSK